MNDSDTMVIQTRGLSKTFKDVRALDRLDLNVRKNSIFGFLGPMVPARAPRSSCCWA